jgi:hypothetical protein
MSFRSLCSCQADVRLRSARAVSLKSRLGPLRPAILPLAAFAALSASPMHAEAIKWPHIVISPPKIQLPNVPLPKADGFIADHLSGARDATAANINGGIRDAGTFGGDLVDGGRQVLKTPYRAAEATIRVIQSANWDKPLEALGTIATAPSVGSWEAVATGMDNSVVFRVGVQFVATSALGPAGGALLAAGYTYDRSGGDLNQALLVGSVTAATGYAAKGVMNIKAPSLASGFTVDAAGASAAKILGVAAISGVGNVAKGGDFSTGFYQGALYAGAKTVNYAVVGSSPEPSFKDVTVHTDKLAVAFGAESGSFEYFLAVVPSAAVSAVAAGAHKPIKKPKVKAKQEKKESESKRILWLSAPLSEQVLYGSLYFAP